MAAHFVAVYSRTGTYPDPASCRTIIQLRFQRAARQFNIRSISVLYVSRVST